MSSEWISLGRVGIVPKGEYSSTTSYNRGDLVFYENASYIAIKNNLINITPVNDNINWTMSMKAYEELPATNVYVNDTYNIVGNGAGSKGILQTFLDNIGNRIANKIVNSDNFQTILANYIVNNLTTTESNYALDARQGNKDISGTLAALIQGNTDSINMLSTNLKLYVISEVYTANNSDYVYLNIPKNGDTLINAYNQNRDENQAEIVSVSCQNGTYIAFFDRTVSQNIQIQTIWCRW